jgi:tRNA1(Val) A37 N6-methylase TrmN6
MNYEAPTQFKGWTIPGPRVNPPEHLREPSPGETLDALSGHFKIFQLRDGHRFSTDDLLAAWYGTSWAPLARRVLDLGSGIGSVGMTAAWRLPLAQFVTVEAQSESVRLARKSAEFNGLTHRYQIREGDFRSPDIISPEEKFDLVLGSPPYFPLGSGITAEHPQKVACRFELRGTVADYCQTAVKHLEPGGLFACVFPMNPPEQNERVFEGARAAGLSIIRQRPIALREGEPPLLAVSAMMRASDLPEKIRDRTWFEPELIIRCKDGTVHPEYQAVKLSFGFPP